MNIIKKAITTTNMLVGEQAIVQGIHYRPSVYTTLTDVDEVTVACNRLTRCLAIVNDKEKEMLISGTDNPCGAEELIKHRFLVPDDFDEYQFCCDTRELMKLFSVSDKKRNYVIMTTLDCNARCFYCYQMGRNKNRIPMSEETASAVADYIIKNSVGGVTTIQWYGGEPLYNEKVIDIICERLKSAGITYRSAIVTNGYLLTEETLKKACDLWHLFKAQITLDGTEEVYNKVKAYIYKEGNAFDIVLNNMHAALKSGINVSVRVNLDEHNKDDIFTLAKYLKERFAEFDNLAIYSYMLYEDAGAKKAHHSNEERIALANLMKEFEDYCYGIGLNVARKYNDIMRFHRCMADSDDSTVISPDGKLGKCDHAMESEIYATVFSDEVDKDMLSSFKVTLNNREMCEKCSNFPECIRIKKCPEDKFDTCDDAYRLRKEYFHKMSVINAYRNIMKNSNGAKNDI